MPIHKTTSQRPPEWCWLWHSEDRDWFWPRHGTSHIDFTNDAYSHITHWADAHQRPFPPKEGSPSEIPE